MRPESALVDKVVRDVLEKLNRMSPSDNKGLVGLESSINKIESLLRIKSKDVFAVGIWGMGGIGKTTLARAIFDKIKSQFEKVYFQDNVREESEKIGLSGMQKKLLFEILGDEGARLKSILTKERLRCKKILVVLDDVTSFKQMEELIGDDKNFGSAGSRILITSRDKQVLQSCGVNHCNIYKVKGLLDDKSLELFSLHAFKKNDPPIDHLNLSNRVVTYVKGVPLALKVFGSMLFRKSKIIWENAMDNLEINNNREIQDVLKLSYDDLNNVEQNLFLDIACFFVGAKEGFVMEILNASKIGVSILIDKCLINIDHNTIKMHDLLQEMGRKIVEEESKDPCKRNRLWDGEDIQRALTKIQGAKAIEGICLDMSTIGPIKLRCHAFSRMCNLRFVDFYPSSKVKDSWRSRFSEYYCDTYLDMGFNKPFQAKECFCSYCLADEENENKVLALEGLEFNSTELMFLRWFGCLLKSLPSNFDPMNLRALVMPRSNIEQLGNDVQRFGELRHINLSYSKHLTKIPNMSLFPVLKSLNLEGCTSLNGLTSSRPCLNNLVVLNLRGCKSLHSLPTSFQSKSLRYIFLSNCSNLKTAPEISGSVERVFLDGTAIKELPLIKCPSRLNVLYLVDCTRLESLPSTMGQLTHLRYFAISGCSKLERLPNDLGNMKDLRIVAENIAIRELPSSIIHWKNLKKLYLRGCKGQELVDSSLHLLSRCCNLYTLDLSNCEIMKLPDNIGKILRLCELNLSENKFDCIPASIKRLHLSFLDVSYCKWLKSLPELPSSLYWLHAYDCTLLETLSDLSFKNVYGSGMIFNLANCFNLDQHALQAKVNEALQKLQSDDQVQNPHAEASLCYPGNEIPEYFTYQNMGSSITIKLPLPSMRNFIIRLVVCAVVTFPKYRITEETLPAVSYMCEAKDKDGKVMDQTRVVLHSWSENDHHKTRYIESDHVFLGCHAIIDHKLIRYCESDRVFLGCLLKNDHNRDNVNSDFDDSLTIDFDVSVSNEFYFEVYDDIRVRKCGVEVLTHWEEELVEGSIGSDEEQEEESVKGSSGSDEEQEEESVEGSIGSDEKQEEESVEGSSGSEEEEQ